MKTILLIDDEINLLNVYSLMLEKKGYRVFKASDGNEGLKLMLSEDVDLVISDIYMPKKNGLVVIKQIRRILKYCNIPIIIMSAGGTKQNVYRGIELGVNAFLTKPCRMEELCQTVEKILKSNNRRVKKNVNPEIDNKIWKQNNNVSILLVYKNASVTDNLYEFLTERFYKVYIEEDSKKVEEMLNKKNIGLLIFEISSLHDNNFKFLFNIYDQNKYIEIPKIIISEMKNDLKVIIDSFDFQVDKIITKPFEYKNLVKSILQVTDLQYLSKKFGFLINSIDEYIRENKEKETNIVNTYRNKIYKLKNENLEIFNNGNISREEKFQIFCENNKKIMTITNTISKAKRFFLKKKQKLLEAKRIVESKLKSIEGRR